MGNWRKSTYSDANGGDCIEVASTNAIMVRDTTDRGGAVLTVSTEAWQRFVASLRSTLWSLVRLILLMGNASGPKHLSHAGGR